MKHKLSKPLTICLIIYFLVLVFFLGYLVFFTDVKDFMHVGHTAANRDYAAGWKTESGEEADIRDIRAVDQDGKIRVTKTLPSVMEETDALYFSTSNLRFFVYVDGALIYSFDTEENLTGIGDGVSYHMIGLGTKDAGATVLIDGESVFPDKHGGRVNDMQFGVEEDYRYYVIRRNLLGLALSLLMILFGIVLIVFYFGMSRVNAMLQALWGLGLSAILFGVWSLCDIGIPQLLSGITYASRDIVYMSLHLAGFPLIYFVNHITKSKRSIFPYLSFCVAMGSFACLLISRFALGIDMHRMVWFIYCSYAAEFIILISMLVDNELYCRKKNRSSEFAFFYIGAAVFVIASFVDMDWYLMGKKTSVGHGSWFRVGLVVFFIFMAFQIFFWWSSEKSSLERDRFVNRLLQYGMDTEDPETRINKVLEFLCMELHADRAYIFEDMNDGTFDNTYEFCAEGVTPEIDNLKGLPYDGVIDVWYHEYEKGGHILIYDIEKYREVSENMYNVLKPQGIRTLVTGPLIYEGRYIGFFGVDNPPAEMMEEVSEIIRLLMFFLSEMVAQRDNHKLLLEYSFHDSLTGVGNRRAIREFETGALDTSRAYGYIMCDINGLKAVNDHEGHEAGDEMIRSVASCLSKLFGRDHVYRMGGDEFAVYVFEDSKENFHARIEETKSMMLEKGIHVAIGSSYAEAGDSDYRTHCIDADKRMYKEKRAYYLEHGDARDRQEE